MKNKKVVVLKGTTHAVELETGYHKFARDFFKK